MVKPISYCTSERTEDISTDEIRSLDTFKDWNEEQINELINVLKRMSHILCNNWSNKNKIGRKIALDINNQSNIAA